MFILTFLYIAVLGTRWCGVGDIATKKFPLGEAKDTDKCCRMHDHCPVSVKRFQKKYNYFNWRLYTISACWCDDVFKKCLEDVHSTVSSLVKNMFFHVLNMPCFVLTQDENNKQKLKIFK